MPVIVLEARDFASPVFLVRTWEVVSGCATLSLAASLTPGELGEHRHLHAARTFCMFVWCFFFAVSLLVHAVSAIQFHSLLPVSWKNLTATVASLGALMSLSASVLFPWMVMNRRDVGPRAAAAAAGSCLTCLAYASEWLVLRARAPEQRGYMGSATGLLKTVQLWGGCQMMPLAAELLGETPGGVKPWLFWVSAASHAVCLVMALVTVAVIVGDAAGRCLVPFHRFLAGFSLSGVLLCLLTTAVGLANVLRLKHQGPRDLVVMDTAVSGVTLLAYTLDFAISIKLLCDRSHT